MCWRMECEDANLRSLRLHDLRRHTAASQAVMPGENLPLFAKLLGHRRHRIQRAMPKVPMGTLSNRWKQSETSSPMRWRCKLGGGLFQSERKPRMEPSTLGSSEVIVEIVRATLLFFAALVAALFAAWRYRIADRQLRQERFQTASRLLAEERTPSGRESGMIRVSSIVVLGKLAREAPEEYHVAVMRIFEIFLTWTTVFGSEQTVVDVESNDVVEAIRFVESRTEKQRRAERKADYEFGLRGESPFYMGTDGRLRLKHEWVSRVREELDKRNIHSRFMAERHPTD